jgi:tripartite-type tricarboxylate transporter receptor subunit TctC
MNAAAIPFSITARVTLVAAAATMAVATPAWAWEPAKPVEFIVPEPTRWRA